ncbi:hypothetical protein GCM10017714_33050 [Curtobacterium pusillum]|uniref:Pyridoxamine 5'-phosphate oxidase family protein n=1 Tax=Curtobacterium pusillum TaxID=69373 RepID=A0ABX2MAD8_9MICO|nr:pyridoxamine 5'-phosphate oxidase family protein [Curtobacterium pusillum]NUU14791.1 pyridoxamine 5'-phosphate oxidase family protein [Curtobacterium pusillum]GLK31661.1 hypothetical protein GCM10017610_19460 [Curtobacterium pusillum]
MSPDELDGAESPVLRLTPDQCWTHLHRCRLGRIAMIRDGEVEILPVNYVSVDRSIHFATSSSVILAAVEAGVDVAFEVDEHDGWTAWSVIAHGLPERTDEEPPAGYEIRSLLPAPKLAHVRIVPTSITGRLFDQQRFDPATGTGS